MSSPNKHLNISAFAHAARISKPTIRKWLADRSLIGRQRANGTWEIPISELHRIQRHTSPINRRGPRR